MKKDQIKRDLDMKSMFHLQKDISQLKTSSLSASPIQNQAGSPDCRVRTKVKEFPAGNNATSSSHITFLKSLCNHDNYTSSVDIIPLVVSCKFILNVLIFKYIHFSQGLQTFQSITPHGFHGRAGRYTPWNPFIKFFQDCLGPSKERSCSFIKGRSWKYWFSLLLLGLLYREVKRSIEVEPSEENTFPDHLASSLLGIKELDQTQKVLNNVKY